jgi:hypothetical protein
MPEMTKVGKGVKDSRILGFKWKTRKPCKQEAEDRIQVVKR